MEYVIITSARNEEKYIENTIISVIGQKIRPIEWVIVNDGSVDDTQSILDRYSNQYAWIHVINRRDRGFRKSGVGVIEAFYTGYRALETRGWRFIVKLDADLSFDSDYFERCFEYFKLNPRLGIGGGMIYSIHDGVARPEKDPHFHVRGATKIYRKGCWDDIGGLFETTGWDTLDEVRANMLGWETKTFSQLKVVHHRPTGAADGSWKNCIKNGRGSYISGYHPLFMFLKCIRRLTKKPYILGSIGLFYGYASGYMKGIPQVNDRALIVYLRKQQLRRLFFLESIWH